MFPHRPPVHSIAYNWMKSLLKLYCRFYTTDTKAEAFPSRSRRTSRSDWQLRYVIAVA